MTNTKRGTRARLLKAVLLLAPFAIFTTASGGVRAAIQQEPMAKVEPGILEEISTQGEATFFVIMAEKADLAPAPGITEHATRAEFVYGKLTSAAERSQAGVRALLEAQARSFEPFWIINAIKVTGGEPLLLELASRPDVERIVADGAYEIPEPKPAAEEPRIDTVEWNLTNIRAPQVWSTFGARGEGIVVANIDTGVQFNHPALVRQYRGNQGGGNFDHNYNWRDPSNVCGNPSTVPCDNNGHGTHTMGTMVGDDGTPGANQIGVAPNARYIACKGCESGSCSFTALLACGQWVVAPTDLNGQNPRPDLAPHVVNNSWGGGGGSNFYQGIVDSWVAAGIYPAFANGNSGPSCGSSGSPGDYLNSYSAGAYDINNNIASFSGRGPSAFGPGELKPNIAAPGVSVRSSVPSNSYASFSGTSMASPHVAGVVALIWSAAPSILGEIGATRALLDTTARDVATFTCGGTAADNNTWGEGRIDAFAAVDQAPRGPTGTLTGTVTDAGSGLPINGAGVRAVGPTDRSTVASAAGLYSFLLPIGSYDVTATHFGYLSQTTTAIGVTDGGTTIQNFALVAAPSHTVSGHVRDTANNPIASARVTVLGTPIAPATTDATGFYTFPSVPEGSYNLRAEAGRCNAPQTVALVVDGNEVVDFALAQRSDSFGYFCQIVPFGFVDASTVLPLTGDDASVQVTLPFPFTFYGQTHTVAHVSTNGFLNFLAANASFSNVAIPNTAPPNGAVYPLWDDLFVDSQASVRTQLVGAAPNRQFVVEWRNVHFFGDSSRRLRLEVILFENGRILTQYTDINNADGRERGNSATVGIENQTGTVGLQYSFNESSLETNFAVLYRLPPSAFVEGVVSNANDGQPVGGAAVRALRSGALFRQTTATSAGFYRMQLPLDTYTIDATATNYSRESATVVLDVEDAVVPQNFALRTPRADAAPAAVDLIVPANQRRHRVLTLANTGSLDMTWDLRETGGGRVMNTGSTQGLPRNPAYDPNSMTAEGLYDEPVPGWDPTAPGEVIRSWPPTGLALAWGVGYTDKVWLSDIPTNDRNHEFTVAGVATGRNWPTPWAGVWPGDMAYDAARDLMCQVNVGGDNGIHCWDPDTGVVGPNDRIVGSFPWTSISQRGLAYRPDDDSFYVGGWNQGILYHIKGLSHPDKGAVIGQCNPPDGSISGLAWNPAFGIVWAATNSPTDTIYQLNPNTCQVISTLPHPGPGFGGAGLEMDEVGNLWLIDQAPNTVYLIDSGVPSFVDVPWIVETPTNGTLAPGASQSIDIDVDTTGLQPGVYTATLFINTNSGRQSQVRVPVRLIVPAYQVGLDAASAASYLDGLGDGWAPDQAYSAGSWGHVERGNTTSTRYDITGTDDDPIYQSARRGMTEYRFDGLPAGVYQVELRFAEIQNQQPGQRIFDVIVEGGLMIPAHDIAAEVGRLAADNHEAFVTVADGQLSIRLVTRRGFKEPIVNALRVTHRPDR